MKHRYTDLRDKTFIMLSRMDTEYQHAYALTVKNYLESPEDFSEMMGYLQLFNTADELVEFMGGCVTDEDVMHYEDALNSSMLQVRSILDDLNKSIDLEDQEKAKKLVFYLLADMKDEYGWQLADVRSHQRPTDTDNRLEEGESGHALDDLEIM